jgi:glycosyltransferase involved in cell wall biosynthesis
MKIAILIDYNEHRTNLWNGEIIRRGGVGVSGTEQSFVLIGEAFALNGHIVSLISPSCLPNTEYKNVKYENLDTFKSSEEYDILILQSDNRYFLNYSWIKLKKCIFWYESQRFIPVEMLQTFSRLYQNCDILCNTMTDYGLECVKTLSPYAMTYFTDTFKGPNPFMEDVYNNTSFIKEPLSFIFHGGFDRGGHIAYKAFKTLPYEDKKMYVCGYDTLRLKNECEQIEFLNSLDKTSLYNFLEKSEYFIYPLVAPSHVKADYKGNPPNIVHKDTFGCVIAEALAHEVIVLTYPIGAVPEIYKDYLVYLPFPKGAHIESLKSVETTFDSTLNNDDVIENIVNTIKFLESKPELKTIIKKRGRDFIFNTFNSNIIINIWNNSLQL